MISKKRNKKKKNKVKVTVTLSSREGDLLTLYAKDNGTTRPAAIHRFVREALKDYHPQKKEPSNQLTLFDSLQVDIFSNTSKTVDKDN